MATIKSKCPDCNSDISIKIGQSFIDEDLVWYHSIRCSTCGLAIEEDGEDIPDHMRKSIIQQDGLWALLLSSVSQKTLAYRELRKIGVSLTDIAKLNKLKSNLIMVGTKTEVAWMKEKLKKVGVNIEIRRAEREELSLDFKN